MKEIINVKDVKGKARLDIQYVTAAAYHVGFGVLGLIASRAAVLGRILPFGLSFVAGVDTVYMPAGAIGAFLGYFFPAIESGGFRYIAALLAIFAVRIMISSYVKIVENPLFSGLLAILTSGVTAAITLNGMPENIIRYVAECILAGVGAFFVCRVSKAAKHSFGVFSAEELACLLITVSMLLAGLKEVSFYGVDLMHIAGTLFVLCAAKYGGILCGALSGVAVSAVFSFCGDTAQGYITFSFGGIAAGIAAPYGRRAQTAAFALSCAVATAVSGFNTESGALIVEIIFGTTLFALIPRGVGIRLGKVLSGAAKTAASSGAKSLNIRMSMASAALLDVADTIEQVSQKLSSGVSPDFSTVISDIESNACAGCKLRVHCWETKRDKTVEAIVAMTNKKTEDGERKIPEEFRIRCIKSRSMEDIVARKYGEYLSKVSAENRLREIRGVVEDQFIGISDMLSDLSFDFERDNRYDDAAAQNISAAIKNINIRADECGCRIDRYDRMTVEIKTKNTPDLVINKLKLMKAVSLAAERDFGIPAVKQAGGFIFITLTERTDFTVDVGVTQISAKDNAMCGDAYSCFNDGLGHYVAVLSDGMGTGGRAAVDSAMAAGLMSRLLKAGFGYDCSLRMLNSSMLFKSGDESLATVDIASVDLFTGEVQFYKAGAAPTLVRRGGKSGRAESTSLPVGILRDVGFDKAEIKLKDKDIIALVSDGATNDGIDWIREELEAFSLGKSQDLSEQIANSARRRRSDGHEDDITVITLILQKTP